MTTGRINQVTTIRNALAREAPQGHANGSLAGAFARLEFINESEVASGLKR
jgi:hypothetical protein